jgi:hypothetical protein
VTFLMQMAILDLPTGCVEDAVANLREGFQIALRAGARMYLVNGLDCCGHLRAASGRPADAVTVWTVFTALLQRDGLMDTRLAP